mmetsp:Transcript_28578/g.60315  ORF Transcript_28578/g.60315 Transcript_28578/m.60315 type:complete len:417 (+) Transcript_28578:241-1491(+)
MIFILIWRNYIYNRLYYRSQPAREEEKEDHDNIFMQQLVSPHWYNASSIIVVFGNCLLPIQILFGDHQLNPDTGDPYLFGMFCALCHAFIGALFLLNILIDGCIFIVRKILEWGKMQQFQVLMMQLGKKTHRLRAPVTFLLSAKIVLGGAMIAMEDPVVVKITVPIRQLPESLDNFRIIQLSDLHIGVSVGRSRVERAVKIVNGLCSEPKNGSKCDLVALTGDVIDGEPYHLMAAIEPFRHLVPGKSTSKLFVAGNHEHIHQNVDHVIEVLSDLGIDSIVNESIRLPKKNPRKKQLVVVGFDDLSSRQSRGKEQHSLFDGTEPGKDTIVLLAHQPNHLKVAQRHGVDLMLSGHTHAGQFFPGTLGAWLLNAKFSGYYPSEETAVYVSAGTHWWGPPVRYTTRHHEITDIRLIKSTE